MATGALAKVGVEAVVGGLSSFLGDMGKVDSSIKGLVGSGNLVSSAFSSLGNVISGMVGSVFRVLEYTLGTLLADAFRAVKDQIQEVIQSSIDLAGSLQSLRIRLDNMNFNDLTEDEKNMANAMDIVNQRTEEQIDWIQKLSLATPFTNDDISQVYSMARSYGFADGEARGFIDTLANFTAGMDLGGDAMVRVIRQFGQMSNKGKIMQQDLNAMAEGGMVPVNKILDLMREKTGLTGNEFDNFKKTGEAVQMFIETFTEYVENNYANAAEKANRTFKNATNTFKDFLATFTAEGITVPILDLLGGKIATVNDQLQARAPEIEAIFVRIGQRVTEFLDVLLGGAGGADNFTQGMIDSLEGVADWLDENRQIIVGWIDMAKVRFGELKDFLFGDETREGAVQKFGHFLMEVLVPFVKEQVLPALGDLFKMMNGEEVTLGANATPLQNLLQIFRDLPPAVAPAIDLLRAFGDVIITAFGGDSTKTFGEFVRDTLVPTLKDLAVWVTNNKDLLAGLLKAFLAMQVIMFLVNIILSIIGAFVQFGLVAGIIGTVTVVINTFVSFMTWMGNTIASVLWFLFTKFMDWKNNVSQTFNQVIDAIRNKDWVGAGRAVVDGIWRGIQNNWNNLISLVQSLAQNTLNAFNSVFGIRSPSTEMFDAGKNIIAGLSNGITNSANQAVKAMKDAAVAVSLPAVQITQMAMRNMPTQAVSNTTNNFTLNLNTSAPVENVAADFAMMESLAV